ncbi:hypothetical protein [Microbacterium mitrae]
MIQLATISLLVVACGSDGGEVDYSKHEVISGQAQLDPVAGTAQLPLDAYSASFAEDNIVDYAIDLKLAKCAQEEGVPLQAIDRRTFSPRVGYRTFGIWVLDEAAKYGYDVRPRTADEQKILESNTAVAGTEDTIERCLNEAVDSFPRVQQVETLAGRGEIESYDLTMSDAEAKAIIADWNSCVEEEGLSLVEGATLQPNTEGASTEQVLEIAIIDVQCKQKLNVVQQLADIQASYQTVFITENQAALNAERAKIDETIAIAEAYIGENG